MKCYVITIEPEKKIKNKVLNIKNKIFKEIGNQLYLQDPPHSTLYIGYFHDFLGDKFSKEIKSICKKYLPIPIEILKIDNFGKDIISGKESIFLSIKDRKNNIKKIQKDLLELMSKYRINEVPKRYDKSYKLLSKPLQDNINKYGYPFVGDILIPHISFGLFDNYKKAHKIITDLTRDFPYGHYKFNNLVFYELNETTEGLKKIASFSMNK